MSLIFLPSISLRLTHLKSNSSVLAQLKRPYRSVSQLRPQSQLCRSRLGLAGPLSGGFFEDKSDRQTGFAAERRKLLESSASRARAQRVVSTQASAAGGASALPSPPPPKVWYENLVHFLGPFLSLGARLQNIRIGWLDLLTMLRIVVVAAVAVGVFFASKRAWVKVKEKASGESAGAEGASGEEGEQGEGGPMQVLAKGATCLQSNVGPWSMADMTIGLTAMAKLTEKKPPQMPGQEVKDLSEDPKFLLRAQHWRVLSEAVYVKDSASFSLVSSLPESSLVASAWEPHHESFRPAYAVFVDAPYGAVVLAVRGTSHIIDMLLDSGASPEPFGSDGNYAHGGFAHAANVLLEEVEEHIEKAFKDHSGSQKGLKLVIVGHSMGAAVGALIALTLRERYPDLQCWAFCPPACMSLDLAKECKSFTTSFVSSHDLVPRFSLHSVERLRTRIQEFDWDEVDKVAADDEGWQNIKKGMDTFKGVQKSYREAMEKLTGSAEGEDSETAKKAKEMGRQTLEAATGGKLGETAKSFGLQTEDLVGEGSSGCEDDESKDGEGGDCQPPPFHPPGRLLLMACDPPGCGKMPESRKNVAPERGYGSYPTFDEAKKVTWRMLDAEQEDLEEIVVSPWCVSDHMLGNLAEAISYFQSKAPPALP